MSAIMLAKLPVNAASPVKVPMMRVPKNLGCRV
jgi:hypothetical protein